MSDHLSSLSRLIGLHLLERLDDDGVHHHILHLERVELTSPSSGVESEELLSEFIGLSPDLLLVVLLRAHLALLSRLVGDILLLFLNPAL